MIRVFKNDTQWGIAAKVEAATLEKLARSLPRELRGEGSKVIAGNDGFAALLVFGDLPSARLARELLATVTPVYLLDFDDDAPSIVQLSLKRERRIHGHPADFLEGRGIVAPGYAHEPSPIRTIGIVEGTTLEVARRAIPDADVELREHPRGVLVVDESALATLDLAEALGKRAYSVMRDPRDGWFSCVLYEPGQRAAEFSPIRPNPNRPALPDILGETTLAGILRVLQIPGDLLGLPPMA